jgi:FixJ family two-component response regulator
MGQARPRLPIALIIDADENTRNLAAVLFEETEFEVVACESAEAALAVMENVGERIAIVFVDALLPGFLDGADLARMVAARWPRISVVLTAGMPNALAGRLPEGALLLSKPWRALDVLVAAEKAHAA